MNVKEYKNLVAELGCIVEGCKQPAELHHPRFCCGLSQRASDWLVVPLCADHHRHNTWGHAIHSGQTAFELNYLTESEMLAQVIKKLMGE